MSEADFKDLTNSYNNMFISDEAIAELENNAVFLGLIALKDPLREKVRNVVEYA